MPQGDDILIPVTKCDLQSRDCWSEPFAATEKDRSSIGVRADGSPTANLADKSFDCVPCAFQEVK